jgi:hypothetical protein
MKRAVFVSSFVVLAALAACGGDDDATSTAPPDGGTTTTPSPDAATANDGSSTTDSPSGGLCHALQQEGPLVTSTAMAPPAPTPTGGTIQDGKYYLTSYTVYTAASGGPPTKISSTIVITGNVVDGVTFYEGTMQTIKNRTTYTTSGTNYTGTAVCWDPPVDGGVGTATTGYSADATTFTTHIPLGAQVTIVSTYTKQ